jgi:predicted DNA-binding protein (MmcQ/YjbR family)
MAAKKKIAKQKPKPSASASLAAAEAALRKIGMAFPETTEDFPWGHRALKVKGKAFVFMSSEGGEFSLSVKLPDSCDFALMQPYASPTGYGLAKSGWVTARFTKKDKVPVSLLGTWLRESYLAVAPKKIGALLREMGA